MIRGPVVTRKNAGGSRNGDTARNGAVIWTITATAQMTGLNLLTWLAAYLDECSRNGGKPLAGPDLDRFLPLERQPRRPPHLGTAAAITRINPRRTRPHRPGCRTGHAGYQHAISQDSRILTYGQCRVSPVHLPNLRHLAARAAYRD
jgi:hypothetical protein